MPTLTTAQHHLPSTPLPFTFFFVTLHLYLLCSSSSFQVRTMCCCCCVLCHACCCLATSRHAWTNGQVVEAQQQSLCVRGAAPALRQHSTIDFSCLCASSCLPLTWGCTQWPLWYPSAAHVCIILCSRRVIDWCCIRFLVRHGHAGGTGTVRIWVPGSFFQCDIPVSRTLVLWQYKYNLQQ